MGSELVQADSGATDSSEKVTAPAERRPIRVGDYVRKNDKYISSFTNGTVRLEEKKLAHKVRVGQVVSINYTGVARVRWPDRKSEETINCDWLERLEEKPLAPGAEVTFSDEPVSDQVSLNQSLKPSE